MIIVLDYGMGNTGSVVNMIKKIGEKALASSDAERLKTASKIILPGVGSFDHGMEKLESTGLIPILEKRVLQDKIPFLGICLGMQMLTGSSEEGLRAGLGWIDGRTVKFAGQRMAEKLPLPHMGWNTIVPRQPTDFFTPINGEMRYYFVHSYHVECSNRENILALSHYGYDFIAAVRKNNILGVQFHPEKSHMFGMSFLKNFIKEESFA